MTRYFLIAAILFIPSISDARKRQDLDDATQTAKQADEQLRTNPSLTPEQRAEQQQIKSDAVEKIETIGNSEATDPQTQIDVSKNLVTVSEAPRAIPYAERGLALAEKSNDPKLVREALLTSADVFYRTGNYDLSRQRAERILRDNPKDKDAMMLYMQVKGRGAAAARSPAAAENPAGASAAGSRPAESASPSPAAPRVAMASASSRDAQRFITEGWGRMKLDAKDALKFFDRAVAADPESASARVERAKARLAAGDAAGSLQDADAAVGLDPRHAEAYAVRAEANRALGKAEAELLADYEAASKLDGRFTQAFQDLVAKLAAGTAMSGGPSRSNSDVAGRSAPDGTRSLFSDSSKGGRRFALLGASAAVILALVALLLLKKNRPENAATPTPTPRP